MLDRQVRVAEELVERLIPALHGQLGLQLRRELGGDGRFVIDLRAGARRRQRLLALDVALLQLGVLLRHVGEIAVDPESLFRLVKSVRTVGELRLRLIDGDAERLAVDLEQFVAGFDVLAFAHHDAWRSCRKCPA